MLATLIQTSCTNHNKLELQSECSHQHPSTIFTKKQTSRVACPQVFTPTGGLVGALIWISQALPHRHGIPSFAPHFWRPACWAICLETPAGTFLKSPEPIPATTSSPPPMCLPSSQADGTVRWPVICIKATCISPPSLRWSSSTATGSMPIERRAFFARKQ